MTEVKSHGIGSFCDPNALLTLNEFLNDYAGESTRRKGFALIARKLAQMPDGPTKERTAEWLTRINSGQRDLFF